MSRKFRKVITTVWVVFLSVAAVFGFLEDYPGAIAKIFSKGPMWVKNPELWWSVGIAVIALIGIWLIWRKPEEPTAIPTVLNDDTPICLIGEATLMDIMIRMIDRIAEKKKRFFEKPEEAIQLDQIIKDEIDGFLISAKSLLKPHDFKKLSQVCSSDKAGKRMLRDVSNCVGAIFVKKTQDHLSNLEDQIAKKQSKDLE